MKSLVIYFSHTGENYMENGIRNIDKGNTEIVAEKIRDLTGADMFKVIPVNDYPFGYRECCDVAKEELNNDARPMIKNVLDNINEYDTIYIGGPVWWGHYPMAMFTLLEKLDFNGKVVKPFSTHEGSGLGSVISDANKLCKGAIIKDGLAIRGCKASLCDDELKQWI